MKKRSKYAFFGYSREAWGIFHPLGKKKKITRILLLIEKRGKYTFTSHQFVYLFVCYFIFGLEIILPRGPRYLVVLLCFLTKMKVPYKKLQFLLQLSNVANFN